MADVSTTAPGIIATILFNILMIPLTLNTLKHTSMKTKTSYLALKKVHVNLAMDPCPNAQQLKIPHCNKHTAMSYKTLVAYSHFIMARH